MNDFEVKHDGPNNVLTNKLFAYKNHIEKVERTLRSVVVVAILFGCTTLILSAYIAWTVK